MKFGKERRGGRRREKKRWVCWVEEKEKERERESEKKEGEVSLGVKRKGKGVKLREERREERVSWG